MSKQYATYHAEKGAISSGGIGKHIDRAEGAEHTYRHADQERTHLNENILVNEHCKKPLHVGISDRIAEGYSAKNKAGELKAIRKDAVKYTTHILTGSHEQMKKIENDPQARKAWINANLDFIKKEYGEKNIVRFSVHRDEKTMHIHAVTVPLTSDGRLSAKEILGNRKEMSERQDRYAAQMKAFGLERGEKATGVKHENAREYYARIEKAQNSIDKNDFKPQKNVLGVYKSESVKELQNALKSQKTALKTKDLELAKLKEQQKKDAEFKMKITENRKNIDEKLKYVVLSDNAREQVKQEKINEIGNKYGYDVKQKFNFVSHSIQHKTDTEIKEMVKNQTERVAQDKGLSKVDTELLKRSNEVKNIEKYLQNERERRNELDQRRGQNKGRGI
ncbi:hypothetical protein HNV03_13575 (plasmid) [Empedobacter stercoris]|uniref:MobV family relaxase n=2 Tax=Empedobacter stercoris TaxID=1628248 RepID=UPI00166221BE|nr:MobV family relaxase [Empedobacter stercoris]QNT15733.1 hypothetical protein HNV03_13575 [Empedobacter stercoris]